MSIESDLAAAARHPAVPGIVGAVIGLRWAPGATWWERIINVTSGSAIAGYVGPAAAEVFDLATPASQSALGFGLGLFGISLATALMQALRNLQLGDILADWLRRR
jgi:hypothetical protein